MKIQQLRPEFVDFVPDSLERGVLYVSVRHATVVHSCCCGCGSEIVTPLSPIGWSMSFDGKSISLYPSVGNWGLPCRSHYFIRSNQVEWARRWAQPRIDAARSEQRGQAAEYFGLQESTNAVSDTPGRSVPGPAEPKKRRQRRKPGSGP